jgi:hypothetical protein
VLWPIYLKLAMKWSAMRPRVVTHMSFRSAHFGRFLRPRKRAPGPSSCTSRVLRASICREGAERGGLWKKTTPAVLSVAAFAAIAAGVLVAAITRT